MYKVVKTMEIAGAHCLTLDYESKCARVHGHNWKVKAYLKAEELDENGMVMDFTHIKRDVQESLDHYYINDIIDGNPTAENIARWIAKKLGPKCYKVSVKESAGNKAVFKK